MLTARMAGYATGPEDGPAVVLIHGFPLNRHMWEAQEASLAEAGYRVILPDLRGHGKTPPVPGVATMDLMAKDVLRLLDTLGVTSFVAVGHSMGGYVALALHRVAPDRIRGLVLANTRADADDAKGRDTRDALARRLESEGIDVLVATMVPKMLADRSLQGRPDVRPTVEAMVRQTPVDGAVNALMGMKERPDATPQLETIHVPTLLVAGSEDPITPPGGMEAMAASIADSTLHVIEATAHLSSLEDPDAFNGALLNWLRRVVPTKGPD